MLLHCCVRYGEEKPQHVSTREGGCRLPRGWPRPCGLDVGTHRPSTQGNNSKNKSKSKNKDSIVVIINNNKNSNDNNNENNNGVDIVAHRPSRYSGLEWMASFHYILVFHVAVLDITNVTILVLKHVPLLLEFLENSWNFVIFIQGTGKLQEKQLFSLYFWNSP